MMIEEIDNMIRHAKAQETTAYQAKKQGYHKLQEHIDRVYGDDLLNHYKVKNYAIQVRPSYESSNIDLYVNILQNEYSRRSKGKSVRPVRFPEARQIQSEDRGTVREVTQPEPLKWVFTIEYYWKTEWSYLSSPMTKIPGDLNGRVKTSVIHPGIHLK